MVEKLIELPTLLPQVQGLLLLLPVREAAL
jgi:hypothetical protein